MTKNSASRTTPTVLSKHRERHRSELVSLLRLRDDKLASTMPRYLSMVKADNVTTDKPVVKPVVLLTKMKAMQMSASTNGTSRK